MTSTTSSFAVTAIVVAACILFAAVVLFATWRYMRRDDDLFPFEAASAEWARALNPNVSRAGSTVDGPVAGTVPGRHARQAGREVTADQGEAPPSAAGSEDRASLPRPEDVDGAVRAAGRLANPEVAVVAVDAAAAARGASSSLRGHRRRHHQRVPDGHCASPAFASGPPSRPSGPGSMGWPAWPGCGPDGSSRQTVPWPNPAAGQTCPATAGNDSGSSRPVRSSQPDPAGYPYGDPDDGRCGLYPGCPCPEGDGTCPAFRDTSRADGDATLTTMLAVHARDRR